MLRLILSNLRDRWIRFEASSSNSTFVSDFTTIFPFLDDLGRAAEGVVHGPMKSTLFVFVGPETYDVHVESDVGGAIFAVDRWPTEARTVGGQRDRVFEFASEPEVVATAIFRGLAKLRSQTTDEQFTEAGETFPTVPLDNLKSVLKATP